MSTEKSGKKLLVETRDFMRRLHYSIHTERAYCDWIARFVQFHHVQERKEQRVPEGLTREEMKRVLAFVEGTAGLVVKFF